MGIEYLWLCIGAIVGALAGGVSGLIATGSFKGALQGAIFGAITGGFAKGLSHTKAFSSSIRAIEALGRGTKIATYAKEIFRSLAHGVIGGVRSMGAAIGALSNNVVVQGLIVATAGGLASQLVGGSFELGFVTAGLAFAVNQLATSLHKYATERLHAKLVDRVAADAADPDTVIPLSNKDLRVIANMEYYEALAAFEKGTSYLSYMSGSADTFLRHGYGGRTFTIPGSHDGTYLGGEVNYIGVGAANAAYGIPYTSALFVNPAQNVIWNVGQFFDVYERGSGGAGDFQNLYNIPDNGAWMHFGFLNANSPIGQ